MTTALNITAATAAPYIASAGKPVVIAGAGPTGMVTAIELAQRGIGSTVLESRGRVGTRDGLFNVVPAFIDELARLDPSGGLVGNLSRSTGSIRTNHISGTQVDQVFGPLSVAADPAAGRGTIEAVLDSARPGTEQGTRAWGKVGIGDLENQLRTFAEQRYPDLIDVRYNTAVEGVRSLNDYAEAITAGPNGTHDTIRGAFLVNANGRPFKAPADLGIAGAPLVNQPDLSPVGSPTHWLGVRFPAQHDTRIVRDRARDEVGVPRTTLALEASDRTWVWAQTGQEQLARGAAEQVALVRQRARDLGLPHPDPVAGARAAAVTVQLAVTTQPVTGRILNVGDANRRPYFSRGTGAASGVVHDAPRAADAIAEALATGRYQAPLDDYARRVLDANAKLMDASLAAVAEELDPAR